MDISSLTGFVALLGGLFALILGIYGFYDGARPKPARSVKLGLGGLGLLLAAVDHFNAMAWLGLIGWTLVVVSILLPADEPGRTGG